MTGITDDLAGRILDGSPDAVVVCDRAGTVHYWNASAERVFGFAPSEALGGSMDIIIPERFRARHWAGWEAAIEAGASRYAAGQLLAVPALHKDGRQISIEFSIQLVMAADARVNWIAAFIRDVTERYRREKALRAELGALKAVSGRPLSGSARCATESSVVQQSPPPHHDMNLMGRWIVVRTKKKDAMAI